MSTHSKKEKKTKDKNSTTKSYSNKSEKVSWWDTVKNEPVSKFFKDTAASAKKRQSDILKKLKKMGFSRILCEAGLSTTSSLLKNKLIHN